MDSEKLIELVRRHPGLYDLSDASWKDLRWKEIGKELNQTDVACKSRWTNIRDQYRKCLNKQKTTSGQASKKIMKYKYEDQVNFLKSYLQERPTISSIEGNSDTDEDADEYEIPNTLEVDNDIENTTAKASIGPRVSTKKTKQKETASSTLMKYLLENKKNSESNTQKDPTDSFLMGIAATMKSLDPYHANLAKTKIFNAVQEIEMQQIIHNQTSQNTFVWTPPPAPEVMVYGQYNNNLIGPNTLLKSLFYFLFLFIMIY